MGLEDFFDQDHKRNKYEHGHDYRRHDNHQSSHPFDKHNQIERQYLEKIMNNPSLKKLVVTIVIIVLVIVILLIILFFPLITKLFGFVTQNGLQGVMDTLWNGSK